MSQLGRISGPLLADNLLRNGVNLSFSDDKNNPSSIILHLDVNTSRLGVNTASPTRDFTVNGTTQTSSIIVPIYAKLGDLEFTDGRIENNDTTTINFNAQSIINVPTLKTANILINDNNIATYTTGSDLVLQADGSGIINFLQDVDIENTLTISGSTVTTTIDADSISLTGNLSATNDLTVARNATFESISISQNTISTTVSNADLELRPEGNGSVEINTNTNVYGNLFASGNITFVGNSIFGNENTDNIIFNAEVTGNIVPDVNGIYNIGADSKRWSEIKSVLLNGTDIETAAVTIAGVDIGTPQGNVFYVAVNGNDTNKGDHQQGPFATIRHALSVADSSLGGPVTIYIYPGDYQEQLPLYVPPNTTVKGLDLRNVVIRPDTTSQSEDVFLLDGETTIEDLTIRDFFYDSVNDTGYAFRFANNAVITSRSPYIRNVTVITQGSATSPSDPRGFDSGDAGKGALVDGASVNSASLDASMLFHSVTFITPGVDTITMTNGVRVEWLNSFSYFADKGLYATNGATGRLTNDGSTIKKGAEVRSIASASVYGNYGAYADGDETLMYLIGHNFAYIGTGKDVSNDSTLVIQDNEVIELNSGKIYYASTDARGNYRIGDAFFVNLEDGTTSLSGSGVDVTGISSLRIKTGGSQTYIDAEKIETGNLRISGNLIQNLNGNLIFDAASNIINLTGEINIAQNLSATGDINIAGTLITLGNQVTDTIKFEAEVTSSIIPNVNNTYNLGSSSKIWNTVYGSQVIVDSIKIQDNFITTTISNEDLELKANGTGNVFFTSDLEIENNFISTSNTALSDTVFYDLNHTGNLYHTGNLNQTGNTIISENLYTDNRTNFESIVIDQNYISTTSSNANLELRANGSGIIRVPYNDLEINSNLSVAGTLYANDLTVNTSLDFNILTVLNNIEIDDNFITTTVSNSDLELRAAGSGRVYIPNNSMEVDQNLTVGTLTAISGTNINGSLTEVGTVNQTGDYAQTGNTIISQNLTVGDDASFENVKFSNNNISTINSNSNLELRANGTGIVRFLTNATINNNLTVNGTITANNVVVNNNLDLNNLVVLSNIKIDDNYITTTVSNSNLELRAEGMGNIMLSNILAKGNVIKTSASSIVFDTGTNNLDVDTDKALVLPVGTTAQRTSQAGDIRYNTTFGLFEGFATSNVVFNGVYSSNFLTRVRVNNTDNILRFEINNNQVATITDSLNLQNLQVDDINFNNNVISTNVSNSDLEFKSTGTGELVIENVNFKDNTITHTAAGGLLFKSTNFGYHKILGTGGFVVTVGNTGSRRANPEVGEIRFNTTETYVEVYDGVDWVDPTGASGAITAAQFDELLDEWTLILG